MIVADANGPAQAGADGEVSGARASKCLVRLVEAEGYRIELDLSTQVLALDIPKDIGMLEWDAAPLDASRPRTTEAPLSPTFDALRPGFVSASILAQKAKQFDDGLYASIDLAAQNGAGDFPGKRALLSTLAAALATPEIDEAAEVVLAGAQLGGIEIDLPSNAQAPVTDRIQEFLSKPLLSKPISFYTWSEDLGRIFQQDRMLQCPMEDPPGVERLVRLIHEEGSARQIYEGYLSLIRRLTNPFPPEYTALDGLLSDLDRGHLKVPDGSVHFFCPPSQAIETELAKKLYGNRPIPDGFSLIDEFIQRIRTGAISLKPSEASGWYDRQTWALEPLILPDKMPEAEYLRFEPRYREQLVELLKGILTLTRETHIKQLEVPRIGAAAPGPEVFVHPELSAEPLATHYLRRAIAYLFVRGVLADVFGQASLAEMHRMTAAGPVSENLADELHGMVSLFLGAYVTVSCEIGMEPDLSGIGDGGFDTESAAQAFRAWAKELGADPDLGVDARCMVPVFYDIQRKRTKVWVFLGWTERPVHISFAKPPGFAIFDDRGNHVPNETLAVRFASTTRRMAYPATAEIYVDEILNRDEFRQLCDAHKTRSEILAALE